MAGLFACLLFAGCNENTQRMAVRRQIGFYPPEPQKPRVVALGTMQGASAPSERQVELAMFLFGTEPPPPLTIANPTGLAAFGDTVQICDASLGALFQWNVTTSDLAESRLPESVDHPCAITFDANGERLICAFSGVARVATDGSLIRSYVLEGAPYRPASALFVGNEVWASNVLGNRVEVFDAESGEHLRAIGGPGMEDGLFRTPRGMALTNTGEVCVVDMLNNRVQVFDTAGKWLRHIGGPGDSTGQFGRPKDVAVGPDGTVFVTDAFSQRVQAFDSEGRPLLAFGEPGSGIGELTLPSGIAVIETPPHTDHAASADLKPLYYVLVAEQLVRPGVRVYAWLGGKPVEDAAPLPSPAATSWKPESPEMAAINPHWDPSRCDTCHEQADSRLLPIAPEHVDELCLSCHDGVKGPADPHPIGRPARGEHVRAPDGWPTVGGLIVCMTCHDMQDHCRQGTRRPQINTDFLRDYDPRQPLEYCTTCHEGTVGTRFSPHRQRDASGRVREDACLFCHNQRMEIPADGRRRFEPHLRDSTSQLCLNCHGKHWDLSTKGHVERPVTPKIKRWMLMRELSLEVDADPRELERLAARSERPPARLPLGNDKVTCYSCHNPHYAGLFPPGSELGALADNPRDQASALRANWIDLCSECHQR